MSSPARRALRSVGSAVAGAAGQMSRRRIAFTTTVVIIVVTTAWLVPLPTALQMRDWSDSMGPWFPLAFLAAHVVITVFPFPRTAFTLAAGLLFGSILGVAIAVVASTIAAVLALVLVRVADWRLSRLVHHPAIESVDSTLRQRGWSAVLSLRLIPAVPFSVLNYASGASTVPIVPYTIATMVGLIPGTAAVVILGDALTGNISPLLAVVSLSTASLGAAGLAYEIRRHRRQNASSTETNSEPAVGA